jgi:hypothetical protein
MKKLIAILIVGIIFAACTFSTNIFIDLVDGEIYPDIVTVLPIK